MRIYNLFKNLFNKDADYIIASGVVGYWHCRKWKSGLLEMILMDYPAATANFASSYGNEYYVEIPGANDIYRFPQAADSNTPYKFTSVPQVIVTTTAATNLTAVSVSSVTLTGWKGFMRSAIKSSLSNIKFNVYAYGYWK